MITGLQARRSGKSSSSVSAAPRRPSRVIPFAVTFINAGRSRRRPASPASSTTVPSNHRERPHSRLDAAPLRVPEIEQMRSTERPRLEIAATRIPRPVRKQVVTTTGHLAKDKVSVVIGEHQAGRVGRGRRSHWAAHEDRVRGRAEVLQLDGRARQGLTAHDVGHHADDKSDGWLPTGSGQWRTGSGRLRPLHLRADGREVRSLRRCRRPARERRPARRDGHARA